MTPVIYDYNITWIIRTGAALVKALTPFCGKPMDKHVWGTFTQAVADLTRLPLASIRASAASLMGRQLDSAGLHAFSRRIIGNTWRLLDGRTVLTWRGQPLAEWVPVRVLSIAPHVTMRKKRGYLMTVDIYGGLPAGMYATRFMAGGAFAFLAGKVGFKRVPPRDVAGPLNFTNPGQFSGFWLSALLIPSPRSDCPQIDDFTATAAMKRLNKRLIAMRARDMVEPAQYVCPRNVSADKLPCELCAYGRDRCSVATRPLTVPAGGNLH